MSDSSPQFTSDTSRIQTCLGIALIVTYFATRLTNLGLLPIFTDEAVYILWAQKIARNISELWLPVRVENNRPLFFWLIAVSLKIIADPLWAGRFVSVMAGFFTLAGIYFIAHRLRSRWAGLLAGFICVSSPYHLFFDRMAHKAALLGCFFVWLVWLSLRFAQPDEKIRPSHYGLLGFLVALSLLTEATALLFVLIPCIPLFFQNIPKWKPVLASYFAAFAIGFFPYAYLYFTDSKYEIKNIFIPANNGMAQTGVADMVLTFPYKVVGHASGVFDHFVVYLTWPVVLSAIFYFALCLKKMGRNQLIVSASFFLPLLALMGTAGTGFSRYYLFCAAPLVIWSALGMVETIRFVLQTLPRKLACFVFVAGVWLFFQQAARFDFLLLTSPDQAPLSETDQYQYITSEYSGYGSTESVNYLKKMALDKKIAVFTTSYWGVPGDCVAIYLSESPNIDIFMGFWSVKKPLLPTEMETFDLYDKHSAKFLGKFKVKDLPQEVYFITRTPSVPRSFFLELNNNFQLIQSFRKPRGTNTIDIYKLIQPQDIAPGGTRTPYA